MTWDLKDTWRLARQGAGGGAFQEVGAVRGETWWCWEDGAITGFLRAGPSFSETESSDPRREPPQFCWGVWDWVTVPEIALQWGQSHGQCSPGRIFCWRWWRGTFVVRDHLSLPLLLRSFYAPLRDHTWCSHGLSFRSDTSQVEGRAG